MITPEEAVAILYPELVSLVKEEVAKEIQTLAPKEIVHLQNMEKAHPGFLHIVADIESTAVDILEAAITWANGVNPPAASEAANGAGNEATS